MFGLVWATGGDLKTVGYVIPKLIAYFVSCCCWLSAFRCHVSVNEIFLSLSMSMPIL